MLGTQGPRRRRNKAGALLLTRRDRRPLGVWAHRLGGTSLALPRPARLAALVTCAVRWGSMHTHLSSCAPSIALEQA